MTKPRPAPTGRPLRVAGLFAGVGGIELGFERAGHKTVLLCEIDRAADAVLSAQFPRVPRVADVRELDRLPRRLDVLTAGFPCQDLSQAGATRGLAGNRSSLVSHVFRLLEGSDVRWVLLENVPFMLQLGKGAAMSYLVAQLEELGFRWAYRIVDSRAFGLPHRRERVFLLASRRHAPEDVLFVDEREPAIPQDRHASAFGFYWTEGLRGLGWAADSVPTLKGGSGLGIPSPPAIWLPKTDEVVTPDLRDAERLQGFPADWTKPAEEVARPNYRWTLVGNAVTVDVAHWLARRLSAPKPPPRRIPIPLNGRGRWPRAACGADGERFEVAISSWPESHSLIPIMRFLEHPTKLLSARAASGFLSRLREGYLRYPDEFATALEAQIAILESTGTGRTTIARRAPRKPARVEA